jgi:hypothetical protein
LPPLIILIHKISLQDEAEFLIIYVIIIHMTWASRRKIQYLLGLFAVISVIVFIIVYPMLTVKPTCQDGKQNGDEKGVDCGGSCRRYCPSEVSDPVVLWSRAFPLVGNNYNLVSLVRNQNRNAGIERASYEFKIYDTNNLLIGRRSGSTYIPPNKDFAIFESRFDAGQSQIKSVSFDFLPPFVWVKKDPSLDSLQIHVDNIIKGDDKNNPTLTASITNDSIYDLPSFDVIAILYDVNHNAINASKTYKDGLSSNKNTPVFFTWPQAFSGKTATSDIFIQINPFTVSF